MAISRDKKQQLVTELNQLFTNAKSSAAASFPGVTVIELQELRKMAREENVTIKVVKNRLVRVAMSEIPALKDTDTSLLTGQLVYAFSNEDEVMPAQILAKFSKTNPLVELVAGFDNLGTAYNTEQIKALASLPTKDQLRGQVVSVIAAPLTQFLGVANGAQRGMAQVLSQRAEAL